MDGAETKFVFQIIGITWIVRIGADASSTAVRQNGGIDLFPSIPGLRSRGLKTDGYNIRHCEEGC